MKFQKEIECCAKNGNVMFTLNKEVFPLTTMIRDQETQGQDEA